MAPADSETLAAQTIPERGGFASPLGSGRISNKKASGEMTEPGDSSSGSNRDRTARGRRAAGCCMGLLRGLLPRIGWTASTTQYADDETGRGSSCACD